MAITNMPIAPTVTGVYSIGDQTQNLRAASDTSSRALQNAFSLGTKIHDYLSSRKQGMLMEKDHSDLTALQNSIEADKAKLSELKAQLSALKGGI